MMDDRNKTALTHTVTQAAALWLDERGFKPVESEVSVARGWVADLAGVIDPTQTELIALKLLRRSPSWRDREDRARWRAELDALYFTMSCLVEVKTSRADFKYDRKWAKAQPTDLAYLAIPSGLIEKTEWPAGWGILGYTEKGGLHQLRPPTLRKTTTRQRFDALLGIAVRRDHHTRYARWRERQKEDRLRQGAEKTCHRASCIAAAFLDIVRGRRDSVEEALSYHGLKRVNLGSRVMEDLQKLWGTVL